MLAASGHIDPGKRHHLHHLSQPIGERVRSKCVVVDPADRPHADQAAGQERRVRRRQRLRSHGRLDHLLAAAAGNDGATTPA